MDLRYVFTGRGVAEVARAAGVDRSTAWRWSQGRRPDWEHVRRLLINGVVRWSEVKADLSRVEGE